MWPAIIMAYENVIINDKTKAETWAKVVEYLKKLRDYNFLCLVCCCLDILEIITLATKIFESKDLLPFEVRPVIGEIAANIDYNITADLKEDMLTSHLASYSIVDERLFVQFLWGEDTHVYNKDKETVEVERGNISLVETSMLSVIGKKESVCEDLYDLLDSKFENFNVKRINYMALTKLRKCKSAFRI